MPDELLHIQPVHLTCPVAGIIGRAGARVSCVCCGEEIISEREVAPAGRVLCQTCAWGGYYAPTQGVNAPVTRSAVPPPRHASVAGQGATQQAV